MRDLQNAIAKITAVVLSLLLLCSVANSQALQVVATCGTLPQTPVVGSAAGPVTVDQTGRLCAAASVSVSGANAAASATGAAVPADASYNGLNVGGTLQGQTGANPSGTVYSAQTDLTSVGGTTALRGAGATGNGSQRATVAQDVTTIAGSAPGVAGTASANVVTVQGVTSMTPVQVSQATASNLNALVTSSSEYPSGATAITSSATGTTGATVATLAAGTGPTAFICGFSIRANATAAATGNSTVAGTITGTLNFTQWTAPTASGLGVTEMIFRPCVPASAVSTDIVVTSAAPGTGGVVSVSAWGYKK